MPRPRTWRLGLLALAMLLSLAWVVLDSALSAPMPGAPATPLAVAAAVAAATLSDLVRWLRHGRPVDLLSAAALAVLAGGLAAEGLGVEASAPSLALSGAIGLCAGVAARAPAAVAGRLLRLGIAIGAFAVVEAALLVIMSIAAGPVMAGAALPLTIAGSAWLAAGMTAAVLAPDATRSGRQLPAAAEWQLPEFAHATTEGAFLFDGRLRLVDWSVAGAELLGAQRLSPGVRLEDLFGISMAALSRGEGWLPIDAPSPAGEGLEIMAHDHESGLVVLARDALGPASSRVAVERMGRELRATIEELMEARRTLTLQRAEIERSATIDPLTGVASRSAILDRLGTEVAQARRYAHPVAIVLLDIDHFAALNRAHGLDAGDAVLREIALRMRLRIRIADALGRSSGDAFLAILPHTDEAGAATFADALRRRLAQRPVTTSERAVAVTVSAGVAVMRAGEALDADALLARADEALASARGAGGDTIALDRLHGLARIEARDSDAPGTPSVQDEGTQDSGA